MTTKPQVPQDVQKQKEAADELLKTFEQAGGKPAEAAPEKPAEIPEPPKQEEGTPAPPAPESTSDSDGVVKELQQQIDQLTQVTTDLQHELSKAQHRESVLEGKLKAEGPRAAQEIKDLKAEIARLKEGKQAATPASGEYLAEDDKALMEQLGVDEATFRLMAKRFGMGKPVESAKPIDEPIETPPTPEQTAAPQPKVDPVRESANKAYVALVDVKAKGWREVKDTPAFGQFLATKPGGEFGPTYYDILKGSANDLDADITAKVYNTFMKTAKPAQEDPQQRPSREAAASTSKGGGASTATSKNWTTEEIQQFNNDVAQGKIASGSEEYKKIKASIDHFLDNIRVV